MGHPTSRKLIWLGLAIGTGCTTAESAPAPMEDEAAHVEPLKPNSRPRTTKEATTSPPVTTHAPSTDDAPPADDAPPTDDARLTNDAPSNQGAPPADDAPPNDVPRVYAKSRNVWIRSGPTTDTQWIGFLWLGGSVPIRGPQRPSGPGCATGWVPVAPRGWICVDGEQATTDPGDPTLLALYPYRPRVESPWPHSYAAVHDPVRRYPQLPDFALQKAWEMNFERHFQRVQAARSGATLPAELSLINPSLEGRPAPSLPALPRGLSEGRTRIAPRSAMAYSAAFDHEDRAYLLAADLTWVPRDRVQLLPQSDFQGLPLGAGVQLPLAFFRGRERPGFIKQSNGEFTATDARFARLSHVALSGEMEVRETTRYYKLKDRDLWVSSREAVVPTPQKNTPWGAAVGEADVTGLAPRGRATWLEVSILGGWLIAYEGTRPVYVTLISAGRGGTPHPDKDPLETASTPTGRFPIGGKFKTATMESSSTPIVHSDVPWTQNFSGPHAIHSAYWHDDWGSLKSAGCVNVAPRDGKWLFEFTEPPVPTGWHGVKHVARDGPATLLIVHD